MTRQFLLDLTERAVKTFAQALLGVLGVQGTSSVLDVDWRTALGGAALATAISVLTSLLSLRLGVSGTASLTTTVEPTGRHAAPD